MDFEIGDEVIYTANCDNMPEARLRIYDMGTVVGFNEMYIFLRFTLHAVVHKILRGAISHAPYSKKYLKACFAKSLPKIKEAVAARELRRIISLKTPFSVKQPGPAHLLRDFLTDERRSRFNRSSLITHSSPLFHVMIR